MSWGAWLGLLKTRLAPRCTSLNWSMIDDTKDVSRATSVDLPMLLDLKKLQTLTLLDDSLDNVTVQYVVSQLKSLTELDLISPRVTAPGITSLAKGLTRLKRLAIGAREDNMYHPPMRPLIMSDEAVQAIVSSF